MISKGPKGTICPILSRRAGKEIGRCRRGERAKSECHGAGPAGLRTRWAHPTRAARRGPARPAPVRARTRCTIAGPGPSASDRRSSAPVGRLRKVGEPATQPPAGGRKEGGGAAWQQRLAADCNSAVRFNRVESHGTSWGRRHHAMACSSQSAEVSALLTRISNPRKELILHARIYLLLFCALGNLEKLNTKKICENFKVEILFLFSYW